ncbi:MAG: TM2 domain-containing protein [Planctomycetes bacterium]|nr:TM2 domain-containing protein [Planctomycetota bacterium]
MDPRARRRQMKEAAERQRARSQESQEGEPLGEAEDAPLHNTLGPGDTSAVPDELARFASDEVECPFCAERIKAKAKVCKHCGRDVAAPPPKASKPGLRRGASERVAAVHHHHHAGAGKSGGVAAVLAVLLPGLGHIYAGRLVAGLLYLFGLPIGMFVATIVVASAGLAAGAAAGGDAGALAGYGGGVLFMWLIGLLVYLWQIFDAYSSCSPGGARSPRRPRRR